METIYNAHWKFAHFFKKEALRPFLYALSEKMKEGNVCLNLKRMENYFDKERHPFAAEWTIDFSILENHPLIGRDPSKSLSYPFILDDNRLYTQRMYCYEQRFVANIQKMVAASQEKLQREKILNNVQLLQLARNLFPSSTDGQVNWQLIACLTAFSHQFSIITGGPGTGKTTTIAKLLSLLIEENSTSTPLKIFLAAPTGKASARMKESLDNLSSSLERENIELNKNTLEAIQAIEPKTIHRLLGYRWGSIHFKHNKDNPLDADIVVIDECSMIDIALFTKLLDAIDITKTRLILLGDRNQLASVEAGSLFGDLCLSLPELNYFDAESISFFKSIKSDMQLPALADSSYHDYYLMGHIVELQRSYRFSDEKGIGQFSKAVLNGDVDAVLKLQSDAGVIAIFEEEEEQKLMPDSQTDWINYFKEQIIQSYTQHEDIKEALAHINDYKILSAMKRDKKLGVRAINAEIRSKVSKENTEMLGGAYHNQLLMVRQNQANLKLDNGDIGIVRINEKEELFTYFVNKEIPVSPFVINEFEDAYAMTIHKSQGSEFDNVLILIPSSSGDNHQFLTRELLYTAVTRAKKSAVVIASTETLEKMVKNRVQRISGVTKLLQKKSCSLESSES